MIQMTVNKGKVNLEMNGRPIEIITELSVGVDGVLTGLEQQCSSMVKPLSRALLNTNLDFIDGK